MQRQQSLFQCWNLNEKASRPPSSSDQKPPPIETTSASNIKIDPSTAVVTPANEDEPLKKKASSPSSAKVIDLCSEDESSSSSPVPPGEATKKNDARRKASCLDIDDDECMIVEAPTPTIAAAAFSSTNNDNDLEIIGTTGQNALEDFPHARQDCVIFPMKNKANVIKYCKNCYCYICDINASDCTEWDSHCHAKKGDYRWEMKRKQARRKRKLEEGCSVPERSQNMFDFVRPVVERPATRPRRTRTQYWMLREMQRNVRREMQRHTSLEAQRVLSQLQRASRQPTIAPTIRIPKVSTNMWEQELRDERAEVLDEEVIEPPDGNAIDVSHVSVRGLLKQVSKNHSTVVVPPPEIFTTELRPYQKQSLSFMKNVESRFDRPVGWLASEVGMGKSAIVLALVASDKIAVPPRRSSSEVKTTVVLTSVSLMGQWEDEVKKHAPGLRVRRFHPPSRSKVSLDLANPSNLSQIETTDIILSTATFDWPLNVTLNYKFHRVVMDEAHLLGNTKTANLSWAKRLRANRKWCVTATPCTASILDLKSQMEFLGLTGAGPFKRAFDNLVDKNCAENNTDDAAFQEFVAIFSRHVTRHEQSQLVGGSRALQLPSKVSKVVTLKMSSNEKKCFEKNLKSIDSDRMQEYTQNGVAPFTLQQALVHPLSSDKLFTDEWNNSTKITALLQEMKVLQERDPNVRVVVFTQYSHTHRHVVRALEKFFLIPVVYQITGSTSSTNRDAAIRTFQGPRTYPAAMVVMMRSGSTGMTLTKASNLYLMEPSLDPATEIQAMGRINRLGQDRETEMKTFVFADSVEANIVALHKEIESGRIEMNKNKISGEAVKILTNGLSF